MSKNGRLFEISDDFTFGKHEGESVDEVIVDDPEYVEWCLNEIDGFDLDEEGHQLLALSLKGKSP